jgi:type II secretory pathway pseudopilin PulG
VEGRKRLPTPCHTGKRRGFTLLETLLVAGLMSLLVLLISAGWAAFGGPTVDALARCKVAQEARLAVAALSADLGGYPVTSPGRLGTLAQGAFVGRQQPGGSQLWLCFDGGASPNGLADWGPPDTVVVYQVQDGCLVRQDQTAGTSFTVARYVTGFTVQDLGAGCVQLQLTFSYRGLTRTYTWIARDP